MAKKRQQRTDDVLRVPAIEFKQKGNKALYSFAVDAKQLPEFATISRVHRDDETSIQGYQRPEVVRHIASIKNYLESDAPMIPNALVVAFDKRVTFEPLDGADSDVSYSRHGTLVIPLDEEPPGWIVDGQQRSAAVREARVRSFPMAVTAFITDDAAEQRTQFILVNSTRPLPKGLINELLPTTDGVLPTTLRRRRFPAYLLERLNFDEDSVLEAQIKTPTNPEGKIKDNSMLRLIENSLSDGGLYRWRDAYTGEGDVDAMLATLKNFWAAVSLVFPGPFQESPRRSRLVHGVGIVAMGFVMDAIMDRDFRDDVPTVDLFIRDLKALKPICAWTSGSWDFGEGTARKWNELQNTSRDIRLLTNYLLAQYRELVWRQAS